MDVGFILLQAGTSAVQTVQSADPRVAVDVGFGTTFAKVCTDALKGAWGGSVAKPPPHWVPIVSAFGFGCVGIGVAFAMTGFNPFEHIASVLGLGVTGAGPGAIAATTIHKAARPDPEPAAVAIIEPATVPAPPPLPEAVVAPPAAAAVPAADAEPADYRARIMDAAAHGFVGIPYQIDPPPDGVTTLDCSLYVIKVYEAAGLPLSGVRTAEQIRQACIAIHHTEALPGDLVFFEKTYDARGPAGPDGLIASHIGISLGAGTRQMWDHNDTRGTAGIANIGSNYWQSRFIDVRRHPQLYGRSVQLAPVSTGLVHAIDVASYQPADLSDLIRRMGAQHVVVKLYQTVESIGGRTTGAEHSRAQIASARANGCTVGGYCWGYASRDPAESVWDAVGLARSCGVELPALWLDIEPYPSDNSLPNAAWIAAALAECDALGVRGGIYSGRYVWDRLGHPQFPGVPLWTAHYNNRADLEVPSYGAMQLVGHQYTSDPCDRNVFLPEAVA